jgi:O-antigen/teichoic acid export membrane protein
MISFIAVSCNYIFGTLLTAKGSMKQLNILAVFGILINISLNLLLIPEKGSSGAAFASAFTQFFVLVFQITLCYKIFNFKYHLFSIIRIFSFTILFITMVYSIENYLNINWLEKIILNVIGGGLIGLFLKVISWNQFYRLLKHDKSS